MPKLINGPLTITRINIYLFVILTAIIASFPSAIKAELLLDTSTCIDENYQSLMSSKDWHKKHFLPSWIKFLNAVEFNSAKIGVVDHSKNIYGWHWENNGKRFDCAESIKELRRNDIGYISIEKNNLRNMREKLISIFEVYISTLPICGSNGNQLEEEIKKELNPSVHSATLKTLHRARSSRCDKSDRDIKFPPT